MNDGDLKLQAYFDGELPPNEAREVANRLAQDREAVDEIKRLKSLRLALSTFEAGVKVPESREFYWSRIQRAIEGSEVKRPEPVKEPFISRLRRLLAPAAGVAILLVAGLIIVQHGWTGSALPAETALTDSNAFTYRDYSSGTTLVWLSYPADSDTFEDSRSEIN